MRLCLFPPTFKFNFQVFQLGFSRAHRFSNHAHSKRAFLLIRVGSELEIGQTLVSVPKGLDEKYFNASLNNFYFTSHLTTSIIYNPVFIWSSNQFHLIKNFFSWLFWCCLANWLYQSVSKTGSLSSFSLSPLSSSLSEGLSDPTCIRC